MEADLKDINNQLIHLMWKLNIKHNIQSIHDFENKEEEFGHFKNLFVLHSIIESFAFIDNNEKRISYFEHIKEDLYELLNDYNVLLKDKD